MASACLPRSSTKAVLPIPRVFDFSPIHERLRWFVDEGILPFYASAVLRGDEVLDQRAYGHLDLEQRRPFPPDGLVRLYSNTKPIVAIAAMMLVEEGRVDLDAPLATYVPEFDSVQVLRANAVAVDDVEPAKCPIRIRHLMSHTSGLSYGFMQPDSLVDKAYAEHGLQTRGAPRQTLEAFCRSLANMPLAFQPGTRWRYSFASDVLGRVIEVASGSSLGDFLRERLLSPLGMQDTDFHVPAGKRDRFAAMYTPIGERDDMSPGLAKIDDPYTGVFVKPPMMARGGSGLVGSLADHVAFAQMLMQEGTRGGQRFVRPDTLARMLENQLPEGMTVRLPRWAMPGTVFGLGLAIKQSLADGEPRAALGEYQWSGMAGTHLWIAPRADLGMLFFTQRIPGYAHPAALEFRKRVYALIAPE